jgi:hypothetical protein
MASGLSSRSALLTWVVAALLAFSAAVAFAGSAEGKSPAGGKAGLGEARALGAKRCAVDRRLKRVKLNGQVRRRCVRKAKRAVPTHVPQPMYWGATIGSHITGDQAPWDMSALTSFESSVGKSASMVNFFQPFANCDPTCDFYSFPTEPMDDIRAHGSIPVLSWSSQAIPSKATSQLDFQLADVVEGRYDSYIREFATEARDWDHPFFLRFNWEMNGNWFSWSEGVNGNAAGQYVAAWRRVHDIFTSVGASNVTWVWCPFVDPAGSLQDLGSLYPGDEYVDWTGLDGYNWGVNPAGGARGWKSFDQLFRRSYDEIAEGIAPSKPMMLGEFGSTELGGSKADWIGDALARIPAEYPQVRAALWFDKFDDGMDWPIETSSAATGAFAAGIQSPLYVGANYGGLAGGKIAPPA